MNISKICAECVAYAFTVFKRVDKVLSTTTNAATFTRTLRQKQKRLSSMPAVSGPPVTSAKSDSSARRDRAWRGGRRHGLADLDLDRPK